MKLGKKSAVAQRIWALALSAAMVLSMAGCGKSPDGGTPKKEWVWVPEFVTIEDEGVSFYDMQLVGDGLYYMSYDWDPETEKSAQSICRYSLADGQITKTPLSLPEDERNWNMDRGIILEDGGLYTMASVYNEDYSKPAKYICRFDAQGNQVFIEDITEQVGDEGYIGSMGIDGEGRLYASVDATILLFNAEGKNQGKVSLDSAGNGWIRSMGAGKDGKMYVCYYNGNDYVLSDIDFDGKKVGGTYENFPDGNNERLIPGIDKDFLVQNGSKVYEYDVKSQKAEELFSWLDSDINGSSVQNFGVLEDGRILVILMDWESNENSIALLTKKKASEVPQKETIVIASLYGSDLQSAVVKFNKASDKYHISLKEYLDFSGYDGNSEADYQAYMADGVNRLINDITSSNCPDILDLSGVNYRQLAAKGVFEDLGAYLDKSDKLNRSDFLDNVMEAYTVDGTLISIPYIVQIQTLVGKGSDVGTKRGWTIDELIAFADAHPGVQLLDNVSKESIMMYLMLYNADSFVDWSTGECSFDSDEFKSILEFVNRFPNQEDIKMYEEGDLSTATKIQQGDVLLYESNLYSFDEAQICNEIFQGDASYIGYPTVDGSSGYMLSANQAYAIMTKSGNKEGAWEFIESFLTKEEEFGRNGRSIWAFPTMKSKLNAMAEKAVEVEYYTDENGEIMLDENGDPIVMGGSSGISYSDGWSYEYRRPTQEEVDLTLSLIESAKPVAYSQGDAVLQIISEEAAAYYKGQKSVDEAAAVIQSRIKIYVGENK
nr:extracellular solute-binding protein [uncultured Acetatifactor sp.]